VIIVASVSCLYGIGSVETYSAMVFDLKVESVDQGEIVRKLVALQYKRNDHAFQRGTFRVRGDNLEIFPSHYEDTAWRVTFFGDEIEEIAEFDPLTGKAARASKRARLCQFAPRHARPDADAGARGDQVRAGRAAEGAQRRRQAAGSPAAGAAHHFDLEMMAATGSCAGIENYSRFLTGRLPGEPPPTCSNTCPTTRCCSSTKATRRCRRSARWRAATTAAR
jgi:excinuclease ABC subunit B